MVVNQCQFILLSLPLAQGSHWTVKNQLTVAWRKKKPSQSQSKKVQMCLETVWGTFFIHHVCSRGVTLNGTRGYFSSVLNFL